MFAIPNEIDKSLNNSTAFCLKVVLQIVSIIAIGVGGLGEKILSSRSSTDIEKKKFYGLLDLGDASRASVQNATLSSNCMFFLLLTYICHKKN